MPIKGGRYNIGPPSLYIYRLVCVFHYSHIEILHHLRPQIEEWDGLYILGRGFPAIARSVMVKPC